MKIEEISVAKSNNCIILVILIIIESFALWYFNDTTKNILTFIIASLIIYGNGITYGKLEEREKIVEK